MDDMNLFKIQNDLIADQTSDTWYRIMSGGTYFDYCWSFGSTGEGPFSHIADEHRSRAVHREEPSLTLSWGLGAGDEDAQFDWAKRFVNHRVRVFWADFFWNGALIDRVELASVDGGHGIVPLPDYAQNVTDFEVAVAHLVHDLGGGAGHDNPSHYITELDFKRVRDEGRRGAGSR